MSLHHRHLTIAVGCLVFVGIPAMASHADDPLLANGNFENWNGGVPARWTVGVGARNGNSGGESLIQQIEGGGVSLAGDAATTVWRSLSQSIPAESNGYYRLAFETRARDVQREGRQFDNCYVGLFAKDRSGKRAGMSLTTVANAEWNGGSLVLQTGPAATSLDVTVFLSKTGTLEVRKVTLERLQPSDSFALLVDEMDRNYSFFKLKKIDWRERSDRYRARAQATKSTDDFVKVIQPMLAELGDLHVSIETPGRPRIPTHVSRVRPNLNFRAVVRQLNQPRQIGKIGLVGRCRGGFGYVAVGSLTGNDAAFQELEKAVDQLMNAGGLIVDLRGNQGGDERRARRIAGRFTEQPLVYAKSKIRSGPGYDEFSAAHDRVLEPAGKKAYLQPVVCLIGPGCVSSGEGMALMFKALPHATLIGQPTRGASGNPAPLSLPNGVTVHYSRWLSLTPDGTPIEGQGVTPDVVVKHTGAGDPTFDRALKLLKQQVAQSR